MTNTLDEDWRSIPGFPGYSASSVGRVRSEPRTVTASNGQIKHLKGCVLRPAIGTTGYKKVALRAGNRSISVKVH